MQPSSVFSTPTENATSTTQIVQQHVARNVGAIPVAAVSSPWSVSSLVGCVLSCVGVGFTAVLSVGGEIITLSWETSIG
jgi:hypothetical protein